MKLLRILVGCIILTCGSTIVAATEHSLWEVFGLLLVVFGTLIISWLEEK